MNKFVYLIASILNLSFLFFIITKKRNMVTISFAFFCLTLSMWQFMLYLIHTIKDLSVLYPLYYLTRLGNFFIAPAIVFFSYTLIKNIDKRFVYPIYVSLGIALVNTLFSLIFPTELLMHEYGYWPKPDINSFLYRSNIVIFGLIWSAWALFYHYKKANTLERQKVLLIFFATLIGGILAVFNFKGSNPLGTIGNMVFMTITFYAIIRHRLMDIEVVIKRSTYFLILFLIIIYPITITINYFSTKINLGYLNLILIAFIWTLVFLLVDNIKRFLQRTTDKIFFMADYDYGEVLADMTNKLQRITDVEALVHGIDKELKSAFKVDNTGVFIVNHSKTKFHLLTVENIKKVFDKQIDREHIEAIMPIRQNNPIIREIKSRQKNCILYSEIKDDYERTKEKEYSHIMSIMDMIEAKLLIGSVDNDDVTGMIAVGQKKSGQDFKEKDISLLYTLVNQGALVVSKIFEIEEKAKLHAEKEIEAKFREEVEEVNTQLREAIIELERTQEKLIEEEQLSAMGKLAGEVAHDIRNPLSSINRFISSLFDKGCLKNSKLVLADIYKRVEISEAVADKPVVLEYMKFVIANIQEVEDSLFEIKDINTSLRKIAGDFLEYSKVSRDIPTVNLKVVDVISELLAGCEQDCQEKGITIVKNFNSLRCVCLFDYQLQKVFTNIFDNAQKAILEAETVRKEIKVSLYDNGKEMITLEIADSGTGIPEDDLKLIFKPFYTKRKNLQGTGLGLAIIKKIVENNQGIIDVSSVVGVGTTFKISFYCSD
ncbi:MAG: hypothetical protein DKM50_01475 [Candidatus Margulisiibacteriota bacterium]|nr:MAG: hypothetical protein A2X43_08335 [Candidatus Margulisbacteria bacterium GWD2_39_127]PZM83773.1 MAG: hypothetical protein DKM50_01475 [Candidatus Margulisiibacteriota bacterium]HAR63035.1 hypothetical protein [Candidatus Margulisiibacteriota bacterium]HCY36740.1 hypothetical protein [Candidatus Margulisiibacteriota bacterium]